MSSDEKEYRRKHIKDIQSFKLFIWKIVRNLLATAKIILAHISAMNWDQASQQLVKLPEIQQDYKREA